MTFDRREIRIGRTSENDVVLVDPGISRRHARIVEQDRTYLVEDLGSANGTRVNGVQIQGATALLTGDTIMLGTVAFAFELELEASQPVQATGAQTRIVDRTAVVPPERTVTGNAREAAVGRLAYARRQRSPKTRALSLAMVSLVALLTAGGLVWLLWPGGGDSGPSGPEPDSLTVQPVAGSFGYGPGVTWERRDMKVFDFEFTTPTRAVVVLHYQAQDISESEVSVSVNAVDHGFVPADLANAPDRELAQVLSPQGLKRNQKNQVIFDNVKNPPDRETWRVSGLWIEVVPIPELSPEQTVASAQEYAINAAKFYDLRDVGTENLFRAWKGYRDAWLTLESLDAKPELYQTVRFQMSALEHQLDQLCSRLMLDVERSVQLKDLRRARQSLEEVPRYFPTREHRCHNLALQKMAQYDL